MHNYRVVKFGGSHLKTLNDIQRILDVIGLYKQPAILVFSAFHGITDELSDVVEKCRTDKRHIHDFTEKIRQIKYEIFENYIDDSEDIPLYTDGEYRNATIETEKSRNHFVKSTDFSVLTNKRV